MSKANLESISLDIYGNFDKDENSKYILNILLNYCHVEELKSLELYINDWSVQYRQRLMQSISNMHKMKHRGSNSTNSTIPALVDAVLNHCHALESLELIKLFDSAKVHRLFQAIATPNCTLDFSTFGMDAFDK